MPFFSVLAPAAISFSVEELFEQLKAIATQKKSCEINLKLVLVAFKVKCYIVDTEQRLVLIAFKKVQIIFKPVVDKGKA